MTNAAGSVLTSPDLAPLVAKHTRSSSPSLPSLLFVSRDVRRACLSAFSDQGYVHVQCRHLTYTLVPHTPLPPSPGEPVEMPLAWRVALRNSPLFPDGTVVAHVHPVDTLWRGAFAVDDLARVVAASHDALRYVHDGSESVYDLGILLSDVVCEDGNVRAFQRHDVDPMAAFVQGWLVPATLAWRQHTRKVGARRLCCQVA